MGSKLINLDNIKSCWKITIVFANDFQIVFDRIVLRYVDIDKWVCDWVKDHVKTGSKRFVYHAFKYEQGCFNY